MIRPGAPRRRDGRVRGGPAISDKDSWGHLEGGEIAPGLTAVKLLGGGTEYEAYLAFDDFIFAPVVVKVVRPGRLEDEGSLRGLRREIDVLSRVNHPGVVRLLRSGLEAEPPHVVLEHVEGPRLSTLIRRHGPLQPQQYLPLLVDLASALHYFGNLELVHLDIKPTNIIMGSPARLIDLSVARDADKAATLTALVGTDAYMSPEQCRPEGSHRPGYPSDVWGVGATLYEAVTGSRAFPGGVKRSEDLEVRFPQLTRPAAPLPRRTPPVMADLVLACLEPDPVDRPRPHELSDAAALLLAEVPKPKLTFKVRV